MHTLPPDAPLDQAALDELDALLEEAAAPREPLGASGLDGLAVALLSGPRTILPGEWMPWLWDPDHGTGEPHFRDEASLARCLELALRHMNSVNLMLMEQPENYAPVLAEVPAELFQPSGTVTSPDAGEVVWLPYEWCRGFLLGVRTDLPGWDPFIESHMSEMSILVGFGSEEGEEDLAGKELTGEDINAVSGVLAEIARTAHAFFLPGRMAGTAGAADTVAARPHRRAPRPGRNEPCPCGSGRKFKHCHGGRGGLN